MSIPVPIMQLVVRFVGWHAIGKEIGSVLIAVLQ